MIIGKYPCCGAHLMIELPEGELPKIAWENCTECGTKVYHKFSRIDPKSWTEEGFLREYEIDEKTKSVKLKEVKDE